MIHSSPSPYAGKVIRLQAWVRHPQDRDFASRSFTVKDWWDRVSGTSWMFAKGNPACLVYAVRTGFSSVPIPTDDEVLYGHTSNGLGHLIHICEVKADLALENLRKGPNENLPGCHRR